MLSPSARRTEQSISARTKRSIERLLKHQSYVPLPAEERTLLTEMIRAEFRLAVKFENVGFGERKLSVDQLSDLVQDLLLHFDDLDLKGTSPWNVLESLLEEVRIQPPKVIAQTTANPFRSFHSNIHRFERARKVPDAVVFLLTAWADLARCLAVCLMAQIGGTKDKLAAVRVLR